MLDAPTATARSRDAEEVAESKRVARSLQRSEVLEAARRDDELAADLEPTVRAVNEETAMAKRRAADLEQAREEWLTELDSLRATMPWRRTR